MQQFNSGQVTIPLESAGKQSALESFSLSWQSGTPSPSVSNITPCVSTGQPEGVLVPCQTDLQHHHDRNHAKQRCVFFDAVILWYLYNYAVERYLLSQLTVKGLR